MADVKMAEHAAWDNVGLLGAPMRFDLSVVERLLNQINTEKWPI